MDLPLEMACYGVTPPLLGHKWVRYNVIITIDRLGYNERRFVSGWFLSAVSPYYHAIFWLECLFDGWSVTFLYLLVQLLHRGKQRIEQFQDMVNEKLDRLYKEEIDFVKRNRKGKLRQSGAGEAGLGPDDQQHECLMIELQQAVMMSHHR